MKRSLVLACSVALGGALIAGAGQARAADDGYETVVTSVLGTFGLVSKDPAPEIEYRERPPLVLPPQPVLPKPVTEPRKVANWPQDPDVIRRRKALEEARAPLQHSWKPHDEMTRDELMAGRAATSDTRDPYDRCNMNHTNRGCTVMTPDELAAEYKRYQADNPDKDTVIVAGQEPQREYLTQPPRGYMKATRTVQATSEGPEKKWDDSNPRNYYKERQRTEE